jgi:endonuclease YncB( thermonuclease family)
MTMMNRYLVLPLILLVFSAISFAGQFEVTRVIDGDTIKAVTDGQQITIRLVGIECSGNFQEKESTRPTLQPEIHKVSCKPCFE